MNTISLKLVLLTKIKIKIIPLHIPHTTWVLKSICKTNGRYKTQVTGHRSGHRSQVTGHRAQGTGHRAQVTENAVKTVKTLH